MAVVVDRSRGIITMSAADDVVTGYFTPSFFRYVGATTIAHQAILTDYAEEHTLFSSVAHVANYTDMQPYVTNKEVNGFKLGTLDSGIVEIHLR